MKFLVFLFYLILDAWYPVIYFAVPDDEALPTKRFRTRRGAYKWYRKPVYWKDGVPYFPSDQGYTLFYQQIY